MIGRPVSGGSLMTVFCVSGTLFLVYFQTSRDLIPVAHNNYFLVGFLRMFPYLTCIERKLEHSEPLDQSSVGIV